MLDLKVKVQSFGRFLSNMVMPNIGAFIAWGLITALFIPVGWLPNENFAKLVSPMNKYLLPLLIGFTGGKTVYGHRGGVVGSIATLGVILGAEIPMFLGAMIVGPLGGYIIKKFDGLLEGKIKSGFEMLVNNFSAGIIAMLLALISFVSFGPIVEKLNVGLAAGVNWLVQMNLLPLTSLLVEPAKILFLNNAINHGVFSPLGMQQSAEIGKSIFFMIETNPGPGLGILLAYMFFAKGNAKQSAPGAIIIHAFGGIHEIYFPYVLMRPQLIIAAMAGGVVGVFTNVIFKAGLVAPPAPGSILAVMAMAPKGSLLTSLVGVLTATLTSLFIASIIIKATNSSVVEDDLEKAKDKVSEMKGNKKISGAISKIVVACDAGMGSSAMGASILKKKVQASGLNIDVTNKAINDLTNDIDIVITHKDLTSRAKKTVPKATHLSIDNFMDNKFYDNLVEELKNSSYAQGEKSEPKKKSRKPTIKESQIFLGLSSVSKEDAIKEAGKKMESLGFVDSHYVVKMLEREKISTTFLGNFTAIPHGTSDAKDSVLNTGIVILQYPKGVDFGNGNKAHLVIGIAAKNNEHIDIIAKLADIIEDEKLLDELIKTKDIENFIKNFS
ncbi:MAG: PTS mannitol transporter subunit IICBA [Fusobacteriaceae bacterium]